MTDYSKRTNCPLDVGDIVVDGTDTEYRFIDWPTDGPQFEVVGVENDFGDGPLKIQIEANEFATMWTNDELEIQDND